MFAHLTNPTLPVGMRRIISYQKEGLDHASVMLQNGGNEKHET